MIPEGISEIQSGARTQSRKEAARRRASRLERRAMREGRGHAVGFGNGCSVRACSHGVFGADGSFRPAPGLPMNHLANADGRMPIASGTEQPTQNKSVENLVAEFGMLRSAVIRLVEGSPSQSAKVEAKYGCVADGDNHNKKFSLCRSRPIISICPSKRRPTHRKCCSE